MVARILIRGNLNLSSDLRRIGFIKVIVFLTYPSTFTYTSQLVNKYKMTVIAYRDKQGWNINRESGKKMAGKGIGKENVPPNRDFIALNHVLLAQRLHFIRKDVNTWDTYGQILSSLYTSSNGRSLSLNPQTREQLFKTKGLVASLTLGEKMIFCDALLYSDIDGTIPLLLCFNETTKSKSDLVNKYFGMVASWYERKVGIEVISSLKRFYLMEKKRFEKKNLEGGSSMTHREMQVEPRLNFLTDLGLVNKERAGYSLNAIGKQLRDIFLNSDNEDLRQLLDEKERRWTILLSEMYSDDLSEISEEEFDEIFFRVMNFYKSIGLILIPYESVYLSTVALALNASKRLSFNAYKTHLKRLAKSKGVRFSDTVPGRRYIHA